VLAGAFVWKETDMAYKRGDRLTHRIVDETGKVWAVVDEPRALRIKVEMEEEMGKRLWLEPLPEKSEERER
jgi:hypothetical protein